jgi:Fur family ferric uptake transcriptional regulator
MRRGIVKPEDIKRAAPAGQRQTRQRDAILETITQASGPLSIPEIHERAAQALPAIGIATIYRTLKLLQESGQFKR